MKKPLFTGVCTALVTPFLDEKINYPMLEVLLRRQMKAGIKACVICGTTGEAATLTVEEKLELFRRSKEIAGKDMKIIAGTGSNCTAQTVALSQAAENAGVDGLLVVTPYYNKPAPEGMIAHYEAVAQAVRIPMIVYNVPGRTGVDLSAEACGLLCQHPNINGIKEASPDITKITHIRAACDKGLHIWTGNDAHIAPAVATGASGVISVVSNILPEAAILLTEAALDGDGDTALALQGELSPLIDVLFMQTNPIAVKAAMAMIGYDCGPCRLPLTTATDRTLKRLRGILT